MRSGYVPAAVDYSPAEEALDHIPQGLALYVSPAMASRLRGQGTAARAGSAPVRLELLPGGA